MNGDDPGPFGSAGDQQPPGADPAAAVDPPKPFNYWGLRNDSPPVTPSSIGAQLDFAAEWWEHLACGFAKQRNSENPEAWEHYVLAALIYAREAGAIPDELWGGDGGGGLQRANNGDGDDPGDPPEDYESMT